MISTFDSIDINASPNADVYSIPHTANLADKGCIVVVTASPISQRWVIEQLVGSDILTQHYHSSPTTFNTPFLNMIEPQVSNCYILET